MPPFPKGATSIRITLKTYEAESHAVVFANARRNLLQPAANPLPMFVSSGNPKLRPPRQRSRCIQPILDPLPRLTEVLKVPFVNEGATLP